ncbi:unnamed protein product [Peronospora belbahrii]|uniref:DRTGG domain-containing protein n=1 Tax=Peronospora belbahrii TaxID=622444 RepID=A0ABN8CZP7_9STRA|nr:unnamed protein product [Peronospora belbahrii]
MTNSDVRCVVFGRDGDVDLAQVLTFLRGFSVLYGSGLALYTKIGVNTAEMDALAAHEVQTNPIQVNQKQEQHELFARISMDQKEFIVYGKTALLQWMKQHLFESRYSSPSSCFVTQYQEPPLRIFISGNRAQVGKSTVCMGLLGALLRNEYRPSEIAYIKPATQCEKPQLVAKFCRQQGITCCDVGPILFYKGFTREFLKGETETSMELLEKAKQKVEQVGRRKKVVVVDGVGYPAVGAICGVSNAQIAKKIEAPVVLVGTKGVGDAVDLFSLNATYFESHGVKVLGGIFNRLPHEGYYSLENCKENVTAYFEQFQPEKRAYGFIPELTDGGHSALAAEKDENPKESTTGVFLTAAEDELVTNVVDEFVRRVNLAQLLVDVEAAQKGDKHKLASSTEPDAPKLTPQTTKPKCARKFEIPTSFETVEHPSLDTVVVPTSLNTVDLPSSTDTAALSSSFDQSL